MRFSVQKDNKEENALKKPVMYKLTFITMVTAAVLLSGCQSSGLKKDPEKAMQVRTQLAAEYLKSGDLDAAKRALDLALENGSRDPAANMMMGILLQQEGSDINLKKADSYFKRALSADSKDAQIRNNYGTYLFQMQRYPEAVEHLSIAGATLGYNQRFRALENLGRVYLRMDDVANAEKAFRQALGINRDSSIALLELAELLYLRGEATDATYVYQQYVRSVGQKNQGARALWIGIRTARANNDDLGRQALVNQLRALFPESQEYQRYLQLQYSTEAVWK